MLATTYGQNIKEKIIALANEALKNEDHCGTWYYPLGVYNGNRWAIVFAWMDYDDNGDWALYGKMAYQPTNSLMQEYDIDWIMPSAENGDVYDTEIEIADEHGQLSVYDVEWIIKSWDRYRKEYLDETDCGED